VRAYSTQWSRNSASIRTAGVTEKLAYTIAEVVAASGLGRTTIYELIKSGDLPRLKVGTRTLVRRVDLEALLERKLIQFNGRNAEPPRTT
jgi:excisionase family DNA binding protein